MAQQRKDGSYVGYGLSQYKTPQIPLFQQIDISKDELGRMSITSERKYFDVIKSKKFIYALELKYFDLNGKLINHQFSTINDDKELKKSNPAQWQEEYEESTLFHHQHFFTLQNYSLYGQQMTYPMTLDSLYYDRYTFPSDGTRIESTDASPNNIYVPIDAPDIDKVVYHQALAQRAVEISMTKKATDIYTFEGTGYRLYKTILPTKLNDKVNEIFTYEYRDTDPVEEELGKKLKGVDDIGRPRHDKNVQLLQKMRALDSKTNTDRLGFKGILRFEKSNIAFQMRVSIAHMLKHTEKYAVNNVKGKMADHYQISTSWNSFDIDYPIAFRVIADFDGDKAQFVKDVRRFYPEIDEVKLLEMLSGDTSWFTHIAQKNF